VTSASAEHCAVAARAGTARLERSRGASGSLGAGASRLGLVALALRVSTGCDAGAAAGPSAPSASSVTSASSATGAPSATSAAGSGARGLESAAGAASAPLAGASAAPVPSSAAHEPSADAGAPGAASSLVAARGADGCPSGAVRLPGGTFRMRESKREVVVEPFCLDVTEVTVGAYKECVRAGRCSPRCLEKAGARVCRDVPADADWPSPAEALRASQFCNGAREDRGAHPVNCVSAAEAATYCAARGGRLPTEGEWEWAARGGDAARPFPWGAEAPVGLELCWGKPQTREHTCLPGSVARDTSAHGVKDLAGNLSEWVTSLDPKHTHKLRGASWYAVDDGYIRGALEGFESTSRRSEVFGLRCAFEP
jgi:sulfatase modifying factor 1